MDMFSKRYFIWISFAFLSFSTLGFSLNIEYIAYLFALIFVLLATGVLLMKSKRKNLILVAVLVLLASAIGFLNSYFFSIERENIKNKYCGERYICGYVSEVTRSSAFSSEYIIRIENVDGEDVSLSAVLASDFDAGLSVGDFFEANADVVDFDAYAKQNLLSNSYSFDYAIVCVADEDSVINTVEPKFRTSLALKELNGEISDILTSNINGISGDMASALLLGNRDLLPDDVLRDFRRAGTYHMLALSGLHVSIIVAIFEFILKKLYVNKLVRIIILTFLSLFYIALTGFLLSACRSMLMLWFFYLARCIGKRSDSLTSLFAAVSLIVLISPQSVLDIGLVLSFLSTFGIITASEIKSKIDFFARQTSGGKIRKKLVSLLKNAVFMMLASICVFVATLPVLQLYFGEVSLATFFTNLFLGVFVEVLLILSIAIAVFSNIDAVAEPLSHIAELVGETMIDIVSRFSDIKNIVLSLNYPFVPMLVWSLFFASLVLLGVKLKRKVFLLMPVALFSVLLCATVLLFNISRADSAIAEFVSEEKGDGLVLSSNEGFYICDLSSGSYSTLYEASELSKENCFSEISGVILTHYHKEHAQSLEKLCLRQKVRTICLPMPACEKDYIIFGSIFRALEGSGVDIRLYEPCSVLDLPCGELTVSDAVYADGKAHPSIAVSFAYGEDRITVIENPFFKTYLEENEAFRAFISESDLLIFGGHGNLTKESFEISRSAARAEEICFADKDLFLLSDLTPEKQNVYIDVKYKKYVLK